LQRVTQAEVSVDGQRAGATGPGLLLFVGISGEDGANEVRSMADKLAALRIFEDAQGRMNLSALDLIEDKRHIGALVISQFTLYGDVRRGRRPSFTRAAAPDHAKPLVETFADHLAGLGLAVEQGVFGAHMAVTLTNDGPVTIWIDSDELGQSRRPAAAGES
jgi:D-tyrosyl-tRNA(Tyr) deacylase